VLPPILTLLDVTVFSIEEGVFEILSTSHSGAFGSHYIGTNITNHVASRLDYILHEDALSVSEDTITVLASEALHSTFL
jgi:molecular chaperone DnaK (HSP70)